MFELKPTDENINNCLANDFLGRSESIFQFLKILYSLKGQYSLCIDGDWGTGKTFFVKQCIKSIELLNKDISDDIPDELKKYKEKLNSSFKNIDTKNQIFPIYFNAWEYDSNRDPLITFIYSLINDLDIDLEKPTEVGDYTIFDKLKKLLSSFKFGTTIVDPNTGISYGAEIQYTHQDSPNMLKDVISLKNIEENLIDLLNSILTERANKIVIFIDELDRCNPIFAVKLLENFKHFLNDDRFIFVFSTNILELKNTINNFYGNNFNGTYYLQKFFDLQFELPKANLKKYIDNQLKLSFSGWQETVTHQIIDIFDFSLRDCNKYFSMYALVYDYMETQQYVENRKTFEIIKYVIFPVLLACKIKNLELYNNIICGNTKEKFLNIFAYNTDFKEIFKYILDIPEQSIDIELLMTDLYENLFIKKNVDIGTTIMNNQIPISQNNVNTLKVMLSFINNIIKL